MTGTVYKNTVIAAIREFVAANDGDEAATGLLLAVGARILDTDAGTMENLIGGTGT